jgi:predicted RNase H-like HicB family nuclease
MKYAVLIESADVKEEPGLYYAHVPSLGITTHGHGIQATMEAARDLIQLWVEEKQEHGEMIQPAHESILATVDI